jgi:hypothetical protein
MGCEKPSLGGIVARGSGYCGDYRAHRELRGRLFEEYDKYKHGDDQRIDQ